MTTTGKDTASFFENGTTDQFEFCYKLYPQVLKLKAEKRSKKPQELIRLDQWYQNELPKLIKGRGKNAHMVYDELVQAMKWKQSRGKFYPQLSYLVKVNTPRAVMQETKKAFRKLPNLEQAITALSNLKGVGTTMASALLAAAAPDSAPFMADECLMAIPEIEGIDYTTKEYLNFVQHIQSTVERLNTEAGGDVPFWSPHRVELALWSHYVANDLSPELLDEMPGPGSGGGGANTNGSTLKTKGNVTTTTTDGNNSKVLVDGGSEDTNDGDDESLGAAAGRGEINNIATESETDNDNTNPANFITPVSAGVQDGDSNFVSNDSTSQEPIIDENTTQTTATTSTDDGEVGTPLASDSESNLEAPQQQQQLKQKQAASTLIQQQSKLLTTKTVELTSSSSSSSSSLAATDTATTATTATLTTLETQGATTDAAKVKNLVAHNETNNSGVVGEEMTATADAAAAAVAANKVTTVNAPATQILPNKLNNQSSSSSIISINNSNSSDSGSVVSDSDNNVKDLTTSIATAVNNGDGTLLNVSGVGGAGIGVGGRAGADGADGAASVGVDSENSNYSMPTNVNNINATATDDYDDDVDDIDDDEDDEDDIRMVADESSNSNSRSGGNVTAAATASATAVAAVAAVAAAIDHNKLATTSSINCLKDVNTKAENNDSTLSGGAGIPLGQKRALNCNDAPIATTAVIAVGTSLDDQQPDMKKLRSE